MRPWQLRLTLRRSRIQWALLSVVLVVSVLAATLLSTLFLLSYATETFGARTALHEAPADEIRVVQRVNLRGTLPQLVEGAATATATLFEDIPYTTSIQVQSSMIDVRREGRDTALSYFAAMDGIAEVSRLNSGRWALAASDSVVEATIPTALMTDLGLELGDTFEASPLFRRDDVTAITVVGSYTPQDPGIDFWRFDRLHGNTYDANFAMPFSGGLVRKEAYGPIITDLDTVAAFDIGDVTITTVPDFSAISLDQTRDLLGRVDDHKVATMRGVGLSGGNVRVITAMDATIGKVIGSLAVTRSSVLVTGLLLLVLSVAALGQTARLMAERRYTELNLMVARGGSGRQIFRLAFIEALVLGGITAGVSPWLARSSYRAIAAHHTMTQAGMNQDPGLPPLIWVVAGIVGALLVVVLVAPLLKRSSNFVDSEQARSRPGKRAAFQRSGLDFALLILAALAYWQLRSYQTPLITDGAVTRVDPLLAAGPALALLAGSLIAVRLIPAASKALESLAARGQRAVMPLAAWEVGRRSTRAVSAILLLTLAVSVGTFAMSYLTTWRLSQEHQAQYLHPADLMAVGLKGPSIVHRSALESSRIDVTVSPALMTSGIISGDIDQSYLARGSLSGRDITVYATDNIGLQFYSLARLGSDGGTMITAALTSEREQTTNGFNLAPAAVGLEMVAAATASETALNNISATLRAVIRDGNGHLFTVDMGSVPVDGEEHLLHAMFVDTEYARHLTGPLSLVGLQSVWFADDRDNDSSLLPYENRLELTLSVNDIASLEVSQVVPVREVGTVYSSTPVEKANAAGWFAADSSVRVTSIDPRDDQLRAEITTVSNNLRFRAVVLTQSAEPQVGAVPIVLTANLATRLSLKSGDLVLIEINGGVVMAVVSHISPVLPDSNPRQEAIIANVDILRLAAIQAGSPGSDINRWWVGVDDDAIAAYTQVVDDRATVTGRAELATQFMEDPLRIASQAALWLVTGAAIVLAAVGFAVHAVVTVRARHIEFAQLRAVGLQRRQLLRVVSGEALLLSVLGVVFGVTLGVALGYLVAPLVAVGVDGRPPLPTVLVDIPWLTVGLLALEVAAVLALTVFLVSLMLRRINPAQLLRLGD